MLENKIDKNEIIKNIIGDFKKDIDLEYSILYDKNPEELIKIGRAHV